MRIVPDRMSDSAKFTPKSSDLIPEILLMGQADPSDDDIASYIDDWEASPPDDEFTNLLPAGDDPEES